MRSLQKKGVKLEQMQEMMHSGRIEQIIKEQSDIMLPSLSQAEVSSLIDQLKKYLETPTINAFFVSLNLDPHKKHPSNILNLTDEIKREIILSGKTAISQSQARDLSQEIKGIETGFERNTFFAFEVGSEDITIYRVHGGDYYLETKLYYSTPKD